MAPFLSVIKDPATYERFDRVILAHGVRYVADLAYYRYLTEALPNHELLGDIIREQLLYYPTVTREPFRNQGRLTDLVTADKLPADLGLPRLNPAEDRVMLCGSPGMLEDFRTILDGRGFRASKHIGDPGDYVFERAFVEH